MIWTAHYLQPPNRRGTAPRGKLRPRTKDRRSGTASWLRMTLEFAPMGWAIGAAVGVARGNPHGPVVCITGDGSYLMSGQEITTAVEEKLPVVFVILNDHAYGMVMHGQRLAGAEPIAFELTHVDFRRMAESMGIVAHVVDSPADFDQIDFAALLERKGPTLIDVRIDREEVPPMMLRLKTWAACRLERAPGTREAHGKHHVHAESHLAGRAGTEQRIRLPRRVLSRLRRVRRDARQRRLGGHDLPAFQGRSAHARTSRGARNLGRGAGQRRPARRRGARSDVRRRRRLARGRCVDGGARGRGGRRRWRARGCCWRCKLGFACDRDLDAWQRRWREQSEPSAEPPGIWPAAEHPAGFDPLGVTTPTPVLQVLARLASLDRDSRCAWLQANLSSMEQASGHPLSLVGVAAAALTDLGMLPEEGEMLFLLLRLPGAAAHALEQRDSGHKRFPFYELELEAPAGGSRTMTDERTGPELLRYNVGKLRSRVGGCVVGSHATFRDKDLHTDLADASWLEIYLFGITGRRFSKPQLHLLDTMWAYTSYPDARIWNNRVAALAGSTRSTGNLAISAALAVSEGAIFGRGIDMRGQRVFDPHVRRGCGRGRAGAVGAA